MSRQFDSSQQYLTPHDLLEIRNRANAIARKIIEDESKAYKIDESQVKINEALKPTENG